MTIEVERDYEMDDHGEVGGPMSVFWARGHGYDEREFIRAAVDYCLGNDVTVPRIDWDDRPVERWQQNVALRGGGIRYDRYAEPGASPRSPRFPITILDLERPKRRGAPKCAVRDCLNPWDATPAIQVSVPDPDDPTEVAPYMALDFHLCNEHRRVMPDPFYRTVVVPVGSKVVLSASKLEQAAAATVEDHPSDPTMVVMTVPQTGGGTARFTVPKTPLVSALQRTFGLGGGA